MVVSLAVDGDLGKLMTVNGDQAPWGTLQDVRNHIADVATSLDSAQKSLTANWTGQAAEAFGAYLGAACAELDDFTGADQYLIDRTRGLMRDSYAATTGLKHDRYALAQAASDSIHGFQLQQAEVFLAAALGVGLIVGAAAATAVSDGVAVAVLGSVASTAGGEIFAAAKDKLDVSGTDPLTIMRSLRDNVATVLTNYATTCNGILGRMAELDRDIASFGQNHKLPAVPAVGAPGTSFALGTFLPKDADAAVTAAAGHTTIG